MELKLTENTGRGVLIDRTPIMQDIRDTYEVSFLLPNEGAYIALLKGADGIEYRKAIKDGVCKVPKELLSKEQYVELTVHKIDNDRIIQSWDCEPLKITAFCNIRRTQWELSGGLSERGCFDRLVEIEERMNDLPELRTVVETLSDQVADFKERSKQLIEESASLKQRLTSAEANLVQINKHIEDPLGGR